jgi:hypothetical protein
MLSNGIMLPASDERNHDEIVAFDKSGRLIAILTPTGHAQLRPALNFAPQLFAKSQGNAEFANGQRGHKRRPDQGCAVCCRNSANAPYLMQTLFAKRQGASDPSSGSGRVCSGGPTNW